MCLEYRVSLLKVYLIFIAGSNPDYTELSWPVFCLVTTVFLVFFFLFDVGIVMFWCAIKVRVYCIVLYCIILIRLQESMW